MIRDEIWTDLCSNAEHIRASCGLHLLALYRLTGGNPDEPIAIAERHISHLPFKRESKDLPPEAMADPWDDRVIAAAASKEDRYTLPDRLPADYARVSVVVSAQDLFPALSVAFLAYVGLSSVNAAEQEWETKYRQVQVKSRILVSVLEGNRSFRAD